MSETSVSARRELRRGNPLDILASARRDLTALSLIFEDRAGALTLDAPQIDGIVEMVWRVMLDLEEVEPKLAVRGDVQHRDSMVDRASDTVSPAKKDRSVQVGIELESIRHYARAADRLFMDQMTNKGCGIELAECAWMFFGKIAEAVARIDGDDEAPSIEETEAPERAAPSKAVRQTVPRAPDLTETRPVDKAPPARSGMEDAAARAGA